MTGIQILCSLIDRLPWARAELTRAFSPSGFRRLRIPTGVGHLFHLTYEVTLCRQPLTFKMMSKNAGFFHLSSIGIIRFG